MPTSLSTYIAVNYLTDSTYADGTVLTPGGTRELTACKSNSDHIVGVKCDSTSAGSAAWDSGTIVLGAAGTNKQTVATVGRVNVKVLGPVKKGDWLGPAGFQDPVFTQQKVSNLTTGFSAPSEKFNFANDEVNYRRNLLDTFNRTGRLDFRGEDELFYTSDRDSIKQGLLDQLNNALSQRSWQIPYDWAVALGGRRVEGMKKGDGQWEFPNPNGKGWTSDVNFSKIYSTGIINGAIRTYGINTAGCAKSVGSKEQAFATALVSTTQVVSGNYFTSTTIACSLL